MDWWQGLYCGIKCLKNLFLLQDPWRNLEYHSLDLSTWGGLGTAVATPNMLFMRALLKLGMASVLINVFTDDLHAAGAMIYVPGGAQ